MNFGVGPQTAGLRRLALSLTIAGAVAPLISVAAAHTLLALSLLSLLLFRDALRFPPIKLPLALFLCGTVVSLLLSGDVMAGWPQVRKLYVIILPLLCVSTVVRKLDSVLALVTGWGAAAACSALWGLVQFSQRYWAARGAGQSLYEALVGQRITGFMSGWMTFSGELMVTLLLVGAFLLFSPERGKRRRFLAGCAVVIALALVLALTRGPWLGATAGAGYLFWQWHRKSLLALPVLAVLGMLAAPPTVRERIGSLVQPRSKLDSNQHRIVLWRTGLEMVKAHPWFGLGPEQVDRQFARYVPADIARPLPWGWYRHMHNIYLQYAAERGVPVLLAFLWLLGRVLWDLRRAIVRQPPGPGLARALLHGCSAAILGVMVAGLFEHNLGDSEILQMFLTVVAIGYVAAQSGTSGQDVRGRNPRLPGAVPAARIRSVPPATSSHRCRCT
jgi:putative inorganic carbon (hco3(-)) transporter